MNGDKFLNKKYEHVGMQLPGTNNLAVGEKQRNTTRNLSIIFPIFVRSVISNNKLTKLSINILHINCLYMATKAHKRKPEKLENPNFRNVVKTNIYEKCETGN